MPNKSLPVAVDAAPSLHRAFLRRPSGAALAGLEPRRAAGLLLFARAHRGLRVLLTHRGGPYFATKDRGVWTVPQALLAGDEAPLRAARGRFERVLGVELPVGPICDLGAVTLKSKTRLQVFALEAEPGPALRPGTTFELEWPPASGRTRRFPEVDRAEWFELETARSKLTLGQHPFLQRLVMCTQ
jgi:predicted NUDIX family NTP pyrophosphohydrolase